MACLLAAISREDRLKIVSSVIRQNPAWIDLGMLSENPAPWDDDSPLIIQLAVSSPSGVLLMSQEQLLSCQKISLLCLDFACCFHLCKSLFAKLVGRVLTAALFPQHGI